MRKQYVLYVILCFYIQHKLSPSTYSSMPCKQLTALTKVNMPYEWVYMQEIVITYNQSLITKIVRKRLGQTLALVIQLCRITQLAKCPITTTNSSQRIMWQYTSSDIEQVQHHTRHWKRIWWRNFPINSIVYTGTDNKRKT